MMPTLMMVGLGDLAGLTLNLLAQDVPIARLVLAGRDVEELARRRNLALLTAVQLGHHPDIVVRRLDLDDVDGTAEAIAAERPDVVFSTATRQSWRVITQLPPGLFRAVDRAQFGPWLPMHLAPAHKLMRAVRAAGSDARVVNAAFPDAVGPVLATADLAPHTGIGNVANLVPALRGAVALLLDVPLRAVRVSLFTQHYLSHRVPVTGDSGGAPFHLRAWADGRDVTGRFDPEEAFALVRDRFQRTGGAFRQLITAASAVAVLRPMLSGGTAQAHAPAPGGLPGGYAVRIADGRVSVELPNGLTPAEAVAVNTACQRLDGIESIAADGTVTFAAPEMAVMKEVLGYDCPVLPLADADAAADELGARYQSLISKVAQW